MNRRSIPRSILLLLISGLLLCTSVPLLGRHEHWPDVLLGLLTGLGLGLELLALIFARRRRIA